MLRRSRTLRVGPEQLRRAAALVRRTTGMRLELQLAATPPRPRAACGKHAGTVRQLARAVRNALPPGRVAVQGVGVELSSGDSDFEYTVPDLTVCPAGFLASDDRLLHPQDVELAAEVVTPSATCDEQIAAVAGQYAAAGIRALLVLDPRTGHGTWALHTDPVGGHYWVTRHGTFGGGGIPLPEPFRCTVGTERFPRYGPQGAQGS